MYNEWGNHIREIHRNGAIAYAILLIIRITPGDTEYLKNEGLEVLAEIAPYASGQTVSIFQNEQINT